MVFTGEVKGGLGGKGDLGEIDFKRRYWSIGWMQKFVMLSFMMIATSFGFKWETEEIEGMKYVPLVQMSEFYKLPIAASGGPKISR